MTENVDETDYRKQIGKNMKVFHINMLKIYVCLQRAYIEFGAAASFVDVNHDEDAAERLALCSVSGTLGLAITAVRNYRGSYFR